MLFVLFVLQSMQMPGEHREMYVSTTLSIVIFTTVICGGLTEPLLTRMGMKVDSKELCENEDLSDEGQVICCSWCGVVWCGGTFC